MAASPSADLLAALGVSAPRFVARTAIATVWRVARADGTPAALKAWHDGDMRNEAPGLDLMSAWGGAGPARIYRRQAGAVLMEWLDGPSLGDMTLAGDEDGAARLLAEVANALQAARPRVPPGLPRLSDWFEALFALEFDAACPPQARRDLEACRALARRLLATERDVRPLHGDLHHDNVRLGDRGHLAFDAKGLLGERAYELANAFRNPKGAEA
ncbi:MAG: aminoglycoside phosphotransferase family protein, partial [Alphaproteobacteria bacterium]